MRKTTTKVHWSAGWVLLAAACSSMEDPTARIEVTQTNRLAVTAIEIARSDADGRVFELRGVDASGAEVAGLRMHVGSIPDLSKVTDESTEGTEIVLSMRGRADRRLITREMQAHHLKQDSEPAFQEFLELGAVSAVLEQESIYVERTHAAEVGYNWAGCVGNSILASPVANQCCHTVSTYGEWTVFYNAYTSAMVQRYGASYWGYTCRGVNGESCNGTACYWGPYGFARASFWFDNRKPWVYNVGSAGDSSSYCSADFYSSPPAPIFADATGTAGLACGCACNGSGVRCYDSTKPGGCPGAPDCSTVGCTPTGGSGAGDWNY